MLPRHPRTPVTCRRHRPAAGDPRATNLRLRHQAAVTPNAGFQFVNVGRWQSRKTSWRQRRVRASAWRQRVSQVIGRIRAGIGSCVLEDATIGHVFVAGCSPGSGCGLVKIARANEEERHRSGACRVLILRSVGLALAMLGAGSWALRPVIARRELHRRRRGRGSRPGGHLMIKKSFDQPTGGRSRFICSSPKCRRGCAEFRRE